MSFNGHLIVIKCSIEMKNDNRMTMNDNYKRQKAFKQINSQSD